MGQVVSCQTVSIKASVKFQTSLCGIYGGQNGSGTVLSLCNLVFPFPDHSTNATCSFSCP